MVFVLYVHRYYYCDRREYTALDDFSVRNENAYLGKIRFRSIQDKYVNNSIHDFLRVTREIQKPSEYQKQ